MKIFTLLALFSFHSFAQDNRLIVNQYTCESDEQMIDIYFNHNGHWDDPQTDDGFVSIKIKDVPGKYGQKFLVRDVVMKTSIGHGGIPCTTTVQYNTLNSSYQIEVQYCSKKHAMTVSKNGISKVFPLKCSSH